MTKVYPYRCSKSGPGFVLQEGQGLPGLIPCSFLYSIWCPFSFHTVLHSRAVPWGAQPIFRGTLSRHDKRFSSCCAVLPTGSCTLSSPRQWHGQNYWAIFASKSWEHGMKVWTSGHAYTTVAEITLRETYLEIYARRFPQLDLFKVCMDSSSYSAGMQSTCSRISPTVVNKKNEVNWTDSAHHSFSDKLFGPNPNKTQI